MNYIKKKIIKILSFLPDEMYLKIIYLFKMKKKLNLKTPQTYNEKLQWLKINDRKDMYVTMVDKYEVKKYVSTIIGENYIIPTLGIYKKFEEIDFSKLPNQFVIKCTHDSGGVIVVKNKNKFDKEMARKKIKECLKNNFYYYGREWPYKNVEPRIIVEKYMEDKKYHELRDYKFFAFDGKVELMFVATNRQGNGETYFDFFDKKYNHLDIINGHKMNPITPEKPINFEKMIELAEKLSRNIHHLRVDFYEINGNIYFGELTFFHWSGMKKFYPESWDKKLGDLIKLETKKGNKNE